MSSLDSRLLALLRAAPVHLPVGELAASLEVPAPLVAARCTELLAAGFEIEISPTLGCRLRASPDRLIADDLSARLGTCPLAREIVVFAETASTNDVAQKRARQGAETGLVIFAEKQSAGRGRFGRKWESAPYLGLWFSLLLRPNLPPAQWPRLTTWAAVSVALVLERETGLATAIKWPNDVYLGGKKVAGILIESATDTRGAGFAVAGIGVNVNHELIDFPEELTARATSLKIATGRHWDRTDLAAAILRELHAREAQLGARFSDLLSDAKTRSFLLGREVQLRSGATLLEGVAEELDEEGHLLLRKADGALARVTAGEVTVLA